MIFVDTWAWVALADRSDQYADAARRVYQRLARSHERLVTSHYVLGEMLTSLPPRIGVDATMRVYKAIADESRGLRIVGAGDNWFDEALALRRVYSDKPDISFVDLTSMVIMRDIGITDIFTGDRHFEQVGLGFTLHPQHA